MKGNRRKFLVIGLGTGAAAAALGARRWLGGSDCHKRTGFALGAPITMTVVHPGGDEAERALDEAFAELNLVDRLMSLYDPTSQLSELNKYGCLDRPHPHIVSVLRASRELSQRTDGAFDITVQPLWSLYADARQRGRTPNDAELQRELPRIDWRRVDVNEDRVKIPDGTQITLNGIAQGFAADRVLDALRRRGVTHALVDAGEIGSLGASATGLPWKVGIRHPRHAGEFLSAARLDGRCMATSGDYATSFSSDFQSHHIFDPHTGRSPAQCSSVSIVAPTATEADGLSTAVFVLGLERGMQLVRATPRTDALVVLKDGTTMATEHFPSETPG